jgi:RimJ/RimL family protein N-acetyltransferase
VREVPVLTTKRLVIRPFHTNDLETLLTIKQAIGWVNDTHTPAQQYASEKAYLTRTIHMIDLLAQLAQPPYGDRAVCLKETGELIGSVGYVPYAAPFNQLPMFGAQKNPLFTAEVGLMWLIAPQWQGKGFATEAAQALIDFAFAPGPFYLHRLIATTEYDNAASQSVMRKVGMTVQCNPYKDPPWFQVVGVLENPVSQKTSAHHPVMAVM